MHQSPKAQLFLIILLAGSASAAKKPQPALDWKPGILWESPNACDETSPVYMDTFLILGDDTIYHLAHNNLIGRKPNVTERSAIMYAIDQGRFYLQDADGRVFKLSVVKKELDPQAQERLKNGKQPCQP